MERIELLEFNMPTTKGCVDLDNEKPFQAVDALIKSGLYREANQQLQNFLAIDPEDPKILCRVASCYKQLGEYDKSLPIFRILVRVEPSLENRFELAATYEILGELRRAEEMYYEILEEGSTSDELLFSSNKNLGNIHLKMGDFEGAEENYNKAHTLNPHSDVLFVNYGTLEVQKGQFANALDRYRQALQINGENDKAWVGLALMHRECGDHELAWANIEMAIDINSNNETALDLLIDWGFRDGRVPRVLARLKSLILRRPMDEFLRGSIKRVQHLMASSNVTSSLEMPRSDMNSFSQPGL